MIEAVNSVLSNASATRVAVEPNSTARSLAANPDKVQEVAKTPYVSPYISIDRQSNRAVLQIRDSDTGDVVTQYPTEGQLKAYQNAQRISERDERQEAQVTQQTPPIETPEVSEASIDVSSVSTEA